MNSLIALFVSRTLIDLSLRRINVYIYEDLRKSGFTKVKLSHNEYKKYINNYQKPLLRFFCNYYVFFNEDRLKTEVLPNLFNKILTSLLFPFFGMYYGFNSKTFNEIVVDTWKARTRGHFTTHSAFRNEKTKDVFAFLETKKPLKD